MRSATTAPSWTSRIVAARALTDGTAQIARVYVDDVDDVKSSPCSITESVVPELTPVLGSHPAGDVSHKPSGRLPLLSTRPTVTPATLKRAATNSAAW